MRTEQQIRDDFADTLRRLMRKNGFTVQGIADASGYSVSAIMNYRMGRRDISWSRALVLAEVMGCKAKDLLIDR